MRLATLSPVCFMQGLNNIFTSLSNMLFFLQIMVVSLVYRHLIRLRLSACLVGGNEMKMERTFSSNFLY